MKVCTWNIRRATKNRADIWDYILNLKADILLLQEVGSIPSYVTDTYSILDEKAMGKTGNLQRFSTAVLVKGTINKIIRLQSKLDWVNNELSRFSGNLIAVEITLESGKLLNVISVYSPAWPVDKKRLENIDVTNIKLQNNPDIWITEILYSALQNENINDTPWIVSGDFNSSITFDTMWGNSPRGNQEIQDRMRSIGFIECIKEFNKKLVPTFKNPKGGKIIHQMDHVFVSKELYKDISYCTVEKESVIFTKSLSDHLPIVTKFKN